MHGLTDGHGCTDGGTNGCVYSMYIYNSIPIIHTALQIRAGQWSITAKLWLLASHIYNVLIIVTSSFSKKSFFIIFRSSRTSSKQVLLEILQYLRKTSLLESLFNKVAGLTARNFIFFYFFIFLFFFNWDSLHARLNSHYKAWSYKKKKHKKIKAYRKSL